MEVEILKIVLGKTMCKLQKGPKINTEAIFQIVP